MYIHLENNNNYNNNKIAMYFLCAHLCVCVCALYLCACNNNVLEFHTSGGHTLMYTFIRCAKNANANNNYFSFSLRDDYYKRLRSTVSYTSA